MSLYDVVIEAQRTRDCERDLGAPGQRTCKSPMCDRPLRSDNDSGFCNFCQKLYPGRRWYLLSLPEWKGDCKKYMAALRADLKSRGICSVCMKRAAAGSVCGECTAAQVVYQSQKRALRRRIGICAQCPLQSVPDRKMCVKCLRSAAVRSKRNRKLRTARRLVDADRARLRELLAKIPAVAA